ncbi:MAG: hypothetical protein ACR2LT_05490 [Pyrinomonadaceae bacterium]
MKKFNGQIFKNIFQIKAILIFLALIIQTAAPALACGPFTVEPEFSVMRHAGFPLAEYAGGKTGIVPATYGRVSLFVFSLGLNHLLLPSAEQKQVVEAINFRIGDHWTNDDTQTSNEQSENTAEGIPDYLQKWKAVRAKLLNIDVKIPLDKNAPDEHYSYSNCLGDAFETAAKTLEARISQYDAGGDVKEWLKGQDAVFSNCGAKGTIPAELNGNAPEWLKQDRQYQIAAALFYDGKNPEARAAFEQIAADKNSVWSKTANFVVARTFIRQASDIDDENSDVTPTPNPNYNPTANTNTVILGKAAVNTAASPVQSQAAIKSVSEKKKEKKILLDNAEAKLKNILDNASMNEFHPSANRLLSLVRYRNFPNERRIELAAALTQNSENLNIRNNLIDYIWLLDKIEREADDKGGEIDRAAAEKEGRENYGDYHLKLRDVPLEKRDKDLTDWLFTYQAADGFTHAYEKWKATNQTHWLVAALVKTNKNASQVSELLNAADKIERGSAAFATVRYHQIRLLLENGKRAAAKQKLDEVFAADFDKFPVSAQNKFYAQRMIVAANLDEFLKYAQRRAALFVWSDDANEAGDPLTDDKDLIKWKNRTMFDEDAVAFFNEKMPLSVLRQAALSSQLPDYLKKFLVVAVWTRAVVLGNQTVEREFAPLVTRYAPEYSTYFSKYTAATTPANREAAALITILQYPVIEPYVPIGFGRDNSTPTAIDSNRGNWWCAEDANKSNGEYTETLHYDDYNFLYPAVYPNFLTAAQTAEGDREHRQILAAGDSATFLTRRAVDFARRNPANPQTPELLHLAVRSTRYGCKDENTTKLSKQAFDILHQRYPRSEWAKQTPYWF